MGMTTTGIPEVHLNYWHVSQSVWLFKPIHHTTPDEAQHSFHSTTSPYTMSNDDAEYYFSKGTTWFLEITFPTDKPLLHTLYSLKCLDVPIRIGSWQSNALRVCHSQVSRTAAVHQFCCWSLIIAGTLIAVDDDRGEESKDELNAWFQFPQSSLNNKSVPSSSKQSLRILIKKMRVISMLLSLW